MGGHPHVGRIASRPRHLDQLWAGGAAEADAAVVDVELVDVLAVRHLGVRGVIDGPAVPGWRAQGVNAQEEADVALVEAGLAAERSQPPVEGVKWRRLCGLGEQVHAVDVVAGRRGHGCGGGIR